jgi:hypothetical protein
MIDERRAEKWASDAMRALMCHHGKNEEISNLASIVLALLRDREERERYVARSGGQ